MRIEFEYMGLNHVHDAASDDLIEGERFRQAVIDSYINIEAGEFSRGWPILENTPKRIEREGRWVTEVMEAERNRKLGESLAGKSIPSNRN